MARPRQRGQFQRVEKHATSASQVPDLQARAVSAVVKLNLNPGELAGKLQRRLSSMAYRNHDYIKNIRFGRGSLLLISTTFLDRILKSSPASTSL